MKKIYLILFFLFFSLSGKAQNTINDSIVHNGLFRQYMLYVPATYNPNNAVPLLLNLHGYGSNNLQQMFYANFRPIADTANFIIVAPNGTIDISNSRYWNVGFFPSDIDDVGFLTALIDTLSKQYNINPSQIYSTGMSNGGFMSHDLACKTNRFAAIASVTGSITVSSFNSCTPNKTIPVMQIHGTADATVPYNGTANFLPIEDVVNFWVKNNQCDTIPTITDVPNNSINDGATAKHFVYKGTAPVEFYKIENGEHTWPGAPIAIGITCMDFSACKEIWRFLRSFSLINTAISYPNPITSNQIVISPNPVQQNLTIQSKTALQEIQIKNCYGQLVYTEKNIANTKHTISINNLQAGIYLLSTFNGTNWQTQKIIKN